MSPEEIFERNRKRLEANKRLIALNMQSNKPPAKPKQSFFNKVRDKFDANTEADQYRRQVKGDARLYSDQQKNMGRTRISNNPFQRGTNTFRSLAETIKQPYEKLGTGISTAFGEGASLRDYEAKTQQENLTHVENLRKQLTKPTTSLADRAVLRSKIGIASTAAQNSYNRQIKQTQQLERDADPLKQAGNIIQIGTDLAGLGVAGFAGKKFGKDVAQLGWKQASARALPAVGQNAAINTIQGGSGELQSDDPTVAGMFRKAALGAGVGTVADLTLGGFAALPSNRAYKNVVRELANETDGVVVRDTVREIANDLPDEVVEDISKQITRATDEPTVDGIIKQAAKAEAEIATPGARTATDAIETPATNTVATDPNIISGFKQAKTPEQVTESVRGLFPELDDNAVAKVSQELAQATDDNSIKVILERAQAQRKAVTEGVDKATPTGEIAPTPEQQIAEVAQEQPTAPVTSQQPVNADIQANQVIAPEASSQATRAVADANSDIVVPEAVTNADTLAGQFQKQVVDKDANYINYLKQVEKETGQTGLVDQFYYDSGLQRRSNSIANNTANNSENLTNAFTGLTGEAKTNFDRYVELRNEIANANRGLKTKEKLDSLIAQEKQLAPEFGERFSSLNEYYKEWATRLRENNLIDEPTYQSFVKNDDYTHIQRVMDDLAGYTGNSGNSMSLGTTKARLKRTGSERAIQPADITALNYGQKMQSEIQRNQTASNIIDVLVEQGHAKKLPAGQTARKNTIKRIVNGKTEVFEVPRDIKEVADNITPFQLGTLGKIVAAPQRVLRAGATGLSAPFTAANYVKDQVGSAVFSKNAVATHLDPRNAMSGLWNATKDTLGESNDPLWKKFIESSGDTTGYDFLRNAKSAKQASREVRLGTKGKYANMVDSVGSVVRTLEDLNSITEKATRFQNFKGIYQDALNKTGNEADALRTATLAAWQNSVDFSRMGNTAQAINLLIPYFNAGIQGTRLLGRRFGEAPVATSLKTLGFVAMPMTGLTLYNMADEKRKAVYDNISDYEKENNLIIVLPNAEQKEDGSYDGVIKVPLQPGLVNLAQPFRMQAENFASKSNQNEIAQMAQQFFGAFAGPVGTGSFRELEGSLTPQIVKPFTQQNANEDKFTGKEIVPGYIDNATDAQGNPVAEKDKAYDFTSGTARAIGGKLGISPLRVEKFIKDTTAKTGLYALNTADNALAKLGKIPQEQIGGISVKDDIVRRFARAQGKYNYKKSEGGKYYDLVKDVTKGLNGNEKAAWDSIHPSKTNFLGEDIFDENKRLAKYTKAGLYLQHPNVFAAEKAIEMEQRKKGNPANPLYDLPQDQLTKVLLKDALPPGAKDPELSNLYKEEWYKDYKNKTSAFYTALKDKLSRQGKSLPKTDNPYPVASPELQKSMDAYSALPKGTGARSSWIRSNPDTWNAMTTQWQATDDWENKERVKIGLNPIEDEESKSGGSGYGKFGYSKGGKSGSGGGGSGKGAKLKTPKTYITELLGNVPNISSDEIAIRTAPKRAKFKVKTPSGKGRNYKKIKLN